MSTPGLQGQRRLTFFTIGLSVFWMILGGFAFLSSQQETTVTTDWQKAVKPNIQAVLPEQWGFFTKSPREENIVAYASVPSGDWRDATMFPHAQPQHAFGWNRVSRGQGIELGTLYVPTVHEEWFECTDYLSMSECISDAEKQPGIQPIPVRNDSRAPSLCGRLALAQVQLAPWAWAAMGQEHEKSSVLIVEASCSGS